jgi:hypothetical protein
MFRKLESLILALIFALCILLPARIANGGGTPADSVDAWNAIVANVKSEDEKLLALYKSLSRENDVRSGRVVFAPDVRAEQKRNRLRLIQEIIAHDQERIRELERLAKAEGAAR